MRAGLHTQSRNLYAPLTDSNIGLVCEKASASVIFLSGFFDVRFFRTAGSLGYL